MKDTFLKLIKKSGNRRYVRSLKENPEVLKWAKEQVFHFNLKMDTPEMVYLILHPGESPFCSCGGHRAFNTLVKGYRSFCQGHCSARNKNQSEKIKEIEHNRSTIDKEKKKQKTIETCLEKYGVESPLQSPIIQQKIKDTNLEKYGVENAALVPEIQQKIKDTNLEKYGVEYPFDSPDIVAKAHATSVFLYGDSFACARKAYKKQTGFNNPMDDPANRIKMKKTFIINYGTDHPLKNKDVVRRRREKCYEVYKRFNSSQIHISDKAFDILQNETKFKELLKNTSIMNSSRILGIDCKTIGRYMEKFGLELPGRSSYESEIAKYLDGLGVKYKQNDSSILKPLQIDFLLKEHNIGIEFNGLYYHTEFGGKKDKLYHYNKWKKCNETGIQLITIFEDEWLNNPNIIKRKIESLIGLGSKGVGARKLEIRKIKWVKVNSFLKQYHIQGSCNPAKINIGAYYNNELLGVMCFSKPKDKNIEWDLTRFACYQNNPGMASKMLKWFEINHNPKSIVSFSDNRWSNGGLYQNLGFKKDYDLMPEYQYTDYKERFRKEKFRKKKLELMGYDISKTETDIVLNEIGLDRIWDCGKVKWIKRY